jgi:hypothetical protein
VLAFINFRHHLQAWREHLHFEIRIRRHLLQTPLPLEPYDRVWNKRMIALRKIPRPLQTRKLSFSEKRAKTTASY